jgi:hypothetical protein
MKRKYDVAWQLLLTICLTAGFSYLVSVFWKRETSGVLQWQPFGQYERETLTESPLMILMFIVVYGYVVPTLYGMIKELTRETRQKRQERQKRARRNR